MTPKRNSWIHAVTFVLFIPLLLAACGTQSTTSTGSSKPVFGGSITDGLFEEPDSLLPEQSVETYADLVDAAIWAPLFYGDNTGIIQPALATAVPSPTNGGISSDGLTYTIKLRNGLKWSDGSPLTSADVAFTLKLFANSAYAAKTQASEFAKIASVTTPDPTTVVIKLQSVDVAFLALALTDPLNFAPLPQSVYGSMDPASIAKSTSAFNPQVTNGPFSIVDRQKSDHITVKRNPNYFQAPKPYLDQITFKIIPNQNTILTALQSGEIDTSWFLDINKLDTYKTIPGYKVALDKVPGTYEAIYFNETNPFLADLKVRQAITQAINVTPIIQNIWKGIATPTCDDGVATFAHDPSLIPCYTFDTTAAKALLSGDGFTMGSDGYFQKNGKDLELRYSTTAGKAYREQTETIVQDQLKQIGIKIDIVNYPSDTFFGTVLADYTQFDIAEFANSLGYDPDNHTQWGCDQFLPAGGFNISHYCNPEVDAAIKTELSDPNVANRTTAFHTIYKDIIKDLPAMYYYAFPNISVAKANLQNYTPSAAGPSETWNIWDWFLSK